MSLWDRLTPKARFVSIAFIGLGRVNAAKFFGVLFVLCLSAGVALAQTGSSSAPTPDANNAIAADKADIKADMADIKADLAKARAQEKAAAVTRQQIQAIRAALRAKLAALHH